MCACVFYARFLGESRREDECESPAGYRRQVAYFECFMFDANIYCMCVDTNDVYLMMNEKSSKMLAKYRANRKRNEIK